MTILEPQVKNDGEWTLRAVRVENYPRDVFEITADHDTGGVTITTGEGYESTRVVLVPSLSELREMRQTLDDTIADVEKALARRDLHDQAVAMMRVTGSIGATYGLDRSGIPGGTVTEESVKRTERDVYCRMCGEAGHDVGKAEVPADA